MIFADPSADIRCYSADSLGNSESISLALLASDLRALLTSLFIARMHSIITPGFGAHIGLTLLADQPLLASSFTGVGFAIPDSPVYSCQQAIDE